ncbi:4'-phosphopantetheinyl transferase family protein [Derxia gummosa]|uniref:4'-phosphopantetheinyl transferase family protein n=1 Tax=Derxia gummosa DSM 723 TaxID=1121388 RepID=A0A8B6X986_9BURK|nr:4'-phosphopantetheinyl transferase superfamily protein [Derxia gummosa]
MPDFPLSHGRPLALPAGVPAGVEVHCLDIDLSAAAAGLLPAAAPADPRLLASPDWALLNEAEHARLLRLRQPADRLRFLVARAALRRLLGERLGCDPRAIGFVTGAHGKPALHPATLSGAGAVALPPSGASGGLHFNVSHSGARALVALSTAGEVGVDVERIAPRASLGRLAAHAFHPDERAACGEGADVAAFFAIWAGKEAVVKADGRGLSAGLTAHCALPRADGGYDLRWPGAPRRFRAWRLEAGAGHAAALALADEA